MDETYFNLEFYQVINDPTTDGNQFIYFLILKSTNICRNYILEYIYIFQIKIDKSKLKIL